MNKNIRVSSENNILSCSACGKIMSSEKKNCIRCGKKLEKTDNNSLEKTFAWLLAAVFLYIPANILPVMTIVSYGKRSSDTILSGIVKLIHVHMYPVAILVFFASIIVPLVKILILFALLISVKMKVSWARRERSFMFRIIKGIGRWSMLDIFVVAMLCSLVKLEAIASIEPGDGAVAFAGVVVATIFAAESFDSRLIWTS